MKASDRGVPGIQSDLTGKEARLRVPEAESLFDFKPGRRSSVVGVGAASEVEFFI